MFDKIQMILMMKNEYCKQPHIAIEWYRKWKIPQMLWETSFVLQLISELQIKSKIAMSWSSRKKKRAFLVMLILSEMIFCKVCILSKCILYWINFHNIFTDKKTLSHRLFLFIFKTVESLQRILNVRIEDVISPMIKKEVKVKSNGASNNLFCSHILCFLPVWGC